jgi:hypothetical protein
VSQPVLNAGRRTGLPYAQLNLRRNPFGEATNVQRAQLAIVDLEPYVEFLEQERAALVFVGHCGRGKTTHLLALQTQFSSAPYVYLPEDGPQPKVPTREALLILDESQRLRWWQRTLLFRNSGRLIIGTHCDEEPALRKAKRPVHVVKMSGLDLGKLRRVIDLRLEWARRDQGPVPSLSNDDLDALIGHFGDNLRAIEFYLYEVYQRLTHNLPINLNPSEFPTLREKDSHG